MLMYSMTFTFSVPSKWGKQIETVSLTSAQHTARSNYGKVTLVGDLLTPNRPPSLENKVLFAPKYNFSPDDPSYVLLLEREQVSFDGTDCNKVGTSYAAFNP